MANPSVVSVQLVAAVANGIALSQAVGAAGNLVLAGSLATAGVATMDVARRVLITTAGADVARSFTVFGTDRYGNVQSEIVTAIPNTTNKATVRDYKTVTRIAVDAATAGNITAGTNATGSSDWVVDDFLCRTWALAIAVSVIGTVTYTVEHTYDDPNKDGTTLVPAPYQYSMEAGSYVPPHVWLNATLTSQTGDKEANYANQPIFAHRLTVTSGTGQAVMQSIQAGVGSGR